MTKDTLDITAARPERNRADANMERITAAADEVVAGIRANAVTLHKAELAQSLQLAEVTGMIAAFQYNEASNRVAMLKAFAQIRDNGAYKGMTVRDRKSGEAVVIKTWEEFCKAHGYSEQKIREDLKNLSTFGGDFLELQDSLGLGYRELRRLRAGIGQLPEGEREKVLEEINSVQGQDEAVEKLEEVRTRLAEAELRVKELTETMKAKEEVSKKKSDKLEELEVRIERLTSIRPDDEQALSEQVQDRAREAVDDVCRKMRMAAVALIGQCFAVQSDERCTVETRVWMQERVGMTFSEIADSLMTSGLDVDLRQMMTPIVVGSSDPTGDSDPA